jgi:hypothetical protein
MKKRILAVLLIACERLAGVWQDGRRWVKRAVIGHATRTHRAFVEY